MPATAQGPETGLDRLFAALHAAPVRRVRQGKVIAGTAAGLARYFGVDPIVVRVAFVIIAVISGMGITAYLIAWLLLPDDEDTVLLQRAIRDHSGGAITLAVFAVLSFFSADDNGGWAKSVFTTAVLVAAGVFFWRRHARRTGGSAPPPPVSPASAPPAPPTPGAAAHGSPTRGGLSRFDPVTGRWIPAAADPASGPTPRPPVPSQGSSSVAGAGLPVDRVEAPVHPMPTTAGPGRAAMWAPPGSPSVSAGAGGRSGRFRRSPRPPPADGLVGEQHRAPPGRRGRCRRRLVLIDPRAARRSGRRGGCRRTPRRRRRAARRRHSRAIRPAARHRSPTADPGRDRRRRFRGRRPAERPLPADLRVAVSRAPSAPDAHGSHGTQGSHGGLHVAGIALGLLSLVVALLSLAHQLLGLGIDGEWVGPTAALTVGGLLVVIGLLGLIRRR